MSRTQRYTAEERRLAPGPGSGGGKRPTRVLTARVDVSTFELIDQAARLRGIDRQKVIIAGAVREAQRIIDVATATIAAHRRRARQSKRKTA